MGYSNNYGTIASTLHKRQKREVLQQAAPEESLYSSQSNSGEGEEDQSSDFKIEREDKLTNKERVLQSQVPNIGVQDGNGTNAAHKMTF